MKYDQMPNNNIIMNNKPCCDNPGTKENLTDLDRALDELGMLSVTSESRKQYLREMRRRDGAQYTPLCIHMNKEYVTDLMSSSSLNEWKIKNFNRENPKCMKHYKALKMKSSRRVKLLFNPYLLPYPNKLKQERTLSWNEKNETTYIDEASSSSSSSSSGNRSNPASPSKVSRSPSVTGLLRSRSLDDLNSPAWDNEEESQSQQPMCQRKEDIEKVSQQMRHLTVT